VRVHLTMDAVAQTAHFFISTTILFGSTLVIGWHGKWIGTLMVIGWAFFKEAYWDPVHEDPTTEGSGIRDFTWYMIGLLAAHIVLFIKEAL